MLNLFQRRSFKFSSDIAIRPINSISLLVDPFSHKVLFFTYLAWILKVWEWSIRMSSALSTSKMRSETSYVRFKRQNVWV